MSRPHANKSQALRPNLIIPEQTGTTCKRDLQKDLQDAQ